jgi:hypothetical protein
VEDRVAEEKEVESPAPAEGVAGGDVEMRPALLVGGEKDEKEAMIELVTAQAATQRRAELALKRLQNEIAMEREKKKREKAIRRTGGGFIISYSKDI